MTAMAAVTSRSSGEVAGQRALAELAHGQSPYRTTVAEAVRKTLDWLERRTGIAPWSGLAVEPTPAEVDDEMLRAGDAEDEARAGGGDSVYAGKVAHTISWWSGDPVTEPPIPG